MKNYNFKMSDNIKIPVFENFKDSQNFVNNVGKVSEEEGHHPDIIFGWGYA